MHPRAVASYFLHVVCSAYRLEYHGSTFALAPAPPYRRRFNWLGEESGHSYLNIVFLRMTTLKYMVSFVMSRAPWYGLLDKEPWPGCTWAYLPDSRTFSRSTRTCEQSIFRCFSPCQASAHDIVKQHMLNSQVTSCARAGAAYLPEHHGSTPELIPTTPCMRSVQLTCWMCHALEFTTFYLRMFVRAFLTEHVQLLLPDMMVSLPFHEGYQDRRCVGRGRYSPIFVWLP